MKRKLEAMILIGYALSLAVLLAIGFVSYRSLARTIDDALRTRAAQEVLTHLASLLSTTTDIQTGQRGFVITGDEKFLEPYHAGVSRAADEFRRLQRLVDDPGQQRRLLTLQPLLDARRRISREEVELRRTQGFEAARQHIMLGLGNNTHDRIRVVIAETEQGERRLSDLRAQRTREGARVAQTVIALGSAVSILLVSTAIIVIHRSFAARRLTDEVLRTRNEELRIATEQAQAADRLKSAFLATMSHELRTPLNSIIGFTGIILQGLAGPLNPEQSKQLGMVQGSARHLLALINDVLDISKIEAGQLTVHSDAFDVRASVEHVVSAVKPLADKKGLSLRADIAPALGQAIGDQRRVEQVLLNLLNNAIKFTEHGEVALTASVTADAAQIRIADTGIGIKPADLATLFKPFRQVETGPSGIQEGTGLGLAISRRLADLMGGEILAQSEWGHGSTFTFTLPLHVPRKA